MSERKKKMVHERFGDNYVANISRYMTRLTVYVADNNILRTIESADYEGIRLISDIGGLPGMWIGISVITLFEMFQLVADVCKSITAVNEQQALKNTKKHRKQPVDHVVDIHVIGAMSWMKRLAYDPHHEADAERSLWFTSSAWSMLPLKLLPHYSDVIMSLTAS